MNARGKDESYFFRGPLRGEGKSIELWR